MGMRMGIMRGVFVLLTVVWAGVAAAQSQVPPRFDTLFEALQIDRTVALMRREGMAYGEDMAAEMLPDGPTAAWTEAVSRIYDVEKMQALVEAGMAEQLSPTDLAPLEAFFASPEGQRIVDLELTAREAFLDIDVEEAARAHVLELEAEGAAHLTAVRGIIEDSDLINHNVAGALNSNLMFYRGLSDGGAYEMGERDMLAEVWAQEEEVRADTRGWLEAFLVMAYKPLDAATMQAFAALYRTDEGRMLNAALFIGFDRMYAEISYLLGRAVADHAAGQKL